MEYGITDTYLNAARNKLHTILRERAIQDEEALCECILQALMCGDFHLQIGSDGRKMVYEPYALRSRVNIAEKKLEAIQEVLDGTRSDS